MKPFEKICCNQRFVLVRVGYVGNEPQLFYYKNKWLIKIQI